LAETNLPENDHVVRFVPQKLLWEEDGRLVGVFYTAVALRTEKNETYVSLCWLQHFSDDYEDGICHAAQAIGQQRKGIKVAYDGFTVGAVAKIKEAAASKKTRLRIVHFGHAVHTGYSGIKGLPLDNSNQDLLELLASTAFTDTRYARDIGQPANAPKPPAPPPRTKP